MKNRILNMKETLNARESVLLFGPRGSGKSTLLRALFQDRACLWVDLLDPEMEDRYSRRPELLREEIAAWLEVQVDPWVVIDEIQKVPKLLDIVHKSIETTACRFVLTGSSARKLKRGSANLLAGRALVYELYPFTAYELGDAFSLSVALQFGLLPKIYSLRSPTLQRKFLTTYALTYLKEEVWGEHFIRNVDAFRKFLEVAAQSNGKIINFSNIARAIGADDKTVASYFGILEDTLIGCFIEAHNTSVRERVLKHPKFYFFDPGVVRALNRRLTVPLQPQTSSYGEVFEHFFILECIKHAKYSEEEFQFFYLATPNGLEVDLVIENPNRPTCYLEIKSGTDVEPHDVRHLKLLSQEISSGAEFFCVSQQKIASRIGSVKCLPWKDFIKEFFLKI